MHADPLPPYIVGLTRVIAAAEDGLRSKFERNHLAANLEQKTS
jgi:hypothetical protein